MIIYVFRFPAVCRNLRPPRHGDMICDNEVFRENARCTFTCDQPNYKLTNDANFVVLRCLKTGYWDKMEPRCEGKYTAN